MKLKMTVNLDSILNRYSQLLGNKEVKRLSKSILNSFKKAERKKKLAEKRKVMQEKEKDFLAGKISGEEYAKARKEYLILKE